ncbi:MAG: tyrosine--tRNA ligase [Actinomycetota bacterium]|nr:tyrosine--tRNA ligase [Actinomycetota bacterium]
MTVPAAEQLRILLSGSEQVIRTEELTERIERAVATGVGLRVKLGIDPSAPDIHIGHAVPLRKLRRFQQFGHTAVLIIGDFTGLVGDPTGRSETRKVLTAEQIKANAQTYVDQVRRILLPDPLEIMFNSSWLDPLGATGILGLAGKMTVARMLERDDFSKRYQGGQPISVVEFMYPLLQGYDSVAIRSDVELGGTDQIFNLLVGRDLQRDAGMEPQIAFTLPLLEGLDGVQKMSKTYGNYVGVADPAPEMFGKLMRVPDHLIGKYMRLATDIDPNDIDATERAVTAGGPAVAKAKRRLASAVTEIYHGADAARDAESRFDSVHVSHEIPGDIEEATIPAAALRDGDVVWLPALLSGLGLASSNSEARRLVTQGGVRVDGEPVQGEEMPANQVKGRVLQVGRRKFVRLV